VPLFRSMVRDFVRSVPETYLETGCEVRFQVLTAASMKMAAFWVVAPCSLVEAYSSS
jgi:hypothetical protein